MRRPPRWGGTVAACLGVVAALALAPSAQARTSQSGVHLQPCGEVGAQCGTLRVPLDYDRPNGKRFGFAFSVVPATDQAHKRGVLFVNFGGPGVGNAGLFAAGILPQVFSPAILAAYDVVGFDPRGTGDSEGALDCKVDQETQGIYSVPFATPLNLDVRALLGKDANYVGACLQNNRRDILKHASTANVARDMDALRQALGLRKLSYYGFSYGTFVGATYASLFPHNYDRLVLDGALDADEYINDPLADLDEQSAGFETALDRFATACAVDQTACSGFGGTDPGAAFDALVEQANASPIPAPGAARPAPVTGDEILYLALSELYAKQLWGVLGQALAGAASGDASQVRDDVDAAYGLLEDGSFDPGLDRYYLLTAIEQRWERGIRPYLREGNRAWGTLPRTWWNTGYVGLNYAIWPIHDRDAYDGPFHIPDDANTVLEVENRYDPATPYRGALRLARDLGNVRFLRVNADGHTSYGNTGPCADDAIDAYLVSGTLPAVGTVCQADQPFTAPPPATATAASAGTSRARASATRARVRIGYNGRLARPVVVQP